MPQPLAIWTAEQITNLVIQLAALVAAITALVKVIGAKAKADNANDKADIANTRSSNNAQAITGVQQQVAQVLLQTPPPSPNGPPTLITPVSLDDVRLRDKANG